MIACFDAGHGGDDPGAMCNGFVEKDIALTWCKLLERTWEATWSDLGCAFMTRTEDVYPSWGQRYKEAFHADALVSVHVNAGGGRGMEVFFCSPEGMKLAKYIHDAWPGEYKRGIKHDSESQHSSIAILRNTKPPAVLIELGFIDNEWDMMQLNDLAFGLDATQKITDAMETWYLNGGNNA